MRNLNNLTPTQAADVTILYYARKHTLTESITAVAQLAKSISLLLDVSFTTATCILSELQAKEETVLETLLAADTTTPAVKTFEAGKSYEIRFIGDSELRPLLTVNKRTDKSVWISKSGDIDNKRVAIKTDSEGNEYILPYGSYSMAPVSRA